MALVLSGFEVNVSLLGEGQGRRAKRFELAADPAAADDAAAIATALTDANTLITTFNETTAAVITDWSLRTIYEEDAAITIPADANVYKEAYYSVGTNTTGTDKASITIPAPADILYSGDDETTGVLDPSDLALQSFLDNFETGNFRISDGETIQSTPNVLSSRVRSVGSGKNYS